MKPRKLILLGLLLCSCSDAPDRVAEEPSSLEASADERENMIAKASASHSLVFPLALDQRDGPPANFTKVEGREGGEVDAKELIFAVINCAPDVAWYEGGSHWQAIVVPAHSSAIWKNVKVWHPSDAETVGCVRALYPKTFFYTVRNVGYDTIQSTLTQR